MPTPTLSTFWNQTIPAVPSGDQSIVIQSDNATPQDSRTAYPKRMVGDTGSGGKAGTVPPPGAGDAAAGKFLKADGTYAVPPGGAFGWVEEVPTGTMNGVNKVFTLSFTPTAGSLALVNCIPQVEGTDFTISTNTITYTVAPKASDSPWHQARYQH